MRDVHNKIKKTIKNVPTAYWALLFAIFYGTPWTVKNMEFLEGSCGGINGVAFDEETGKFKVFQVMKNGKIKIYK